MFRDDGAARLGILREDGVIDVASAGGADAPKDVLAVIDGGQEALHYLRTLVASTKGDAVRALDGLEIVAPLLPRENVMAVGRNYAKHAEESARMWNLDAVQPPTVFTKALTSVTGPFAPIPIDDTLTSMADWEAELAVVLGREGKNIPRESALDYVFGYTVINDVSARDLQQSWGGQNFKGKSLDGFGPLGPWVVTADEIPDPGKLRVRCRVNGVTKQDASTEEMIYPVDDIIARLSLGMTLLPGNVIATGTPDGVGRARKPPEFLHPGDVLETEVVEIGVMRNAIVAA
ncbi:MAG TPA: fumarylacetoacetate hydrolase family protein [Chloroflexota bacterium]|nr:fumarylacetoacetate hydrolase family protein [Chloroflexota bacterium]